MTDSILFSTCFPTFDDMKLIVSVGVISVYFFGEIDDIKAVELSNNLPKNLMSLEIIHLE